MRFEQLGRVPVRWVELDLDDKTLTIREGTGSDQTSRTQTFASTEAAQTTLYGQEMELRAAGFIQIRRLASAPPDEPVARRQRFEWVDGDKRRFREVEQRDEVVRVIEGEIDGDSERRGEPEISKGYNIKGGTAIYNRHVERTQRDIAGAEQRAHRLAQKRAVRAQGPKPAGHVHAALEAECRATPDAEAPWQVYADWLLEHGNPIGEIAALAIAGDLRAALFAAQDHFVELDPTREALIELELRFGFIRKVTVRSSKPGAFASQLAPILASPACRFVDEIALVGADTSAEPWAEVMAVVTDSPHATSLRALALDVADDSERRYVDYGDLAFAWPKLPALARLAIRGGSVSLGALLPVHTYIRETRDLRRSELASLLAVKHRRLANLVLDTGRTDNGCELVLDDLGPLLAARGVPALRHLGLLTSDLVDSLVAPLARSKLLPQLHSLDLSNGNAGEGAARAFVEHAPRFRHLASLDLSRNTLLRDDVEVVRGVLDNVITNDQQYDRYDDIDE